MEYGELILESLLLFCLGVYLLIPVALFLLIRSEVGQKYGLKHLGTIIGFAPFILVVVAIIGAMDGDHVAAYAQLDRFQWFVLVFLFFLSLFTVILLHVDAKKSEASSMPVQILRCVLMVVWFFSLVASNLALILAFHRGPIM